LGVADARSCPDVTEELVHKIAKRIHADGPLTVAAYMAIALHDRVGGYYATCDPIGAAGDFTTAPEISQVFGELIGLWCADLWQQMERPDPLILVELGPGRGVLMSDLLHAAGAVPEFRRALRLYLVEVSPMLRVEQEHRLSRARPVWVQGVEKLPDGAMLLIANEFLDTLPIRQFVRGSTHWRERMVALDPEGELAFIDGPESPVATLLVPSNLRDSPPGTIAEICPAALGLASALGTRFARQTGAALFIDYGHSRGTPGPTLRALSRHRSTSPLAAPGTADLSAHVDFAAFREAAAAGGAETHGPVTQTRFLTGLGAELRLAMLSARATLAQRQGLEGGVRRLLHRDEMGEQFKVIALTSPGLKTLAGFETNVDQ
jgi:NADH dehydrogenase [ubiquinone] 1 alpha subcomplex assembly factor 7